MLDWGLAKLVGRPNGALDDEPEPDVMSERSADESHALGAILYEVLAGRPPYEGRDGHAVLRQVLAGPPEPPGRALAPVGTTLLSFGVEALDVDAVGRALPVELLALCARCMERDPADRLADAAAVALEARSWLDGARKRERALEVVAAADAVVAEMAELRERGVRLRVEGEALLVETKPCEPEEAKAAGWAIQDEAEQVTRLTSTVPSWPRCGRGSATSRPAARSRWIGCGCRGSTTASTIHPCWTQG